MSEDIVFLLGDKLPLVSEAVIAIVSYAHGGAYSEKSETRKRKNAINNYVSALIELWSNAFGSKYVMARKSVVYQLRKNIVSYGKAMLKGPRSKETNLSYRQRKSKWRAENNHLFDIHSPKYDPLKDYEDVERLFYMAQKSVARTGYISETIDFRYERQESEKKKQKLDEEEAEDNEQSFINEGESLSHETEHDPDYEMEDETASNSSFRNDSSEVVQTRSGLVLLKPVDEPIVIPQPLIRKVRACTDQIKSTCVQVSVNCGLSVAMAILAVKIVCQALYEHTFYLNKEEAMQADSSLKDHQTEEHGTKKPPVSKDDYAVYKNVLPSPKTIADYKQILAVQEEHDAASTLYNMTPDVKCTLHYDTTQRCRIDGEWPALIFSFSSGYRYSLRPLFFAYEDRAQIVRLVTETYLRLGATLLALQNNPHVAKILWEKTTALMTDSVSKNLGIENGVAEYFGSTHLPYHLLCKSHTVEALDRCNLEVLSRLELKLEFRNKLIAMNPSVTSFLRGEKSVVVCGVKSILSLVSREKSASSTNQADLFDFIVEREKTVKHMALYKERRFTKLGYSCASVLNALPYLQMLLNETHLSNQHTDMVRMFLDNELFFVELKVLSYFTFKVTLPLLNAVEVSTQDELCEIFPKLYHDLAAGIMNTLDKFTVQHRHLVVEGPKTELENVLLSDMCTKAAETVELQCGREYGFGSRMNENKRATAIYQLTPAERKGLEKHNLVAERKLGVFDIRSNVAKFRNHKFKAQGIRNDLVLHNSSFKSTPDHQLKQIAKILDKKECKWNAEQKKLNELKILEKMEKAKRTSCYTNTLLIKCKSWGGPTTSVEEIKQILEKKPDIAEQIIRVELSYFRDTHKADVIATPELFKLNMYTHEERLTNFCVLLSGQSSHSIQPLPTPENALKVLRGASNELVQQTDLFEISLNQMCVTLWLDENSQQVWYLGYCVKINVEDEVFTIEHLHRVNKQCNLKWMYPANNDIQDVDRSQIFRCDIHGDWDVTDRNMKYTLKNHVELANQILEL